ncbi:hypothetical protein DXG03_005287 [Asterophora parasitica]|uniref:Pentatricopeptide repeat protein n=1 Tax=Asterophora parasitica TaxID=117018 RepID=A0A9P7KEC0_9AGAR|nr:hypothetical protein DXG03_005287 [Asterophora parasitica]
MTARPIDAESVLAGPLSSTTGCFPRLFMRRTVSQTRAVRPFTPSAWSRDGNAGKSPNTQVKVVLKRSTVPETAEEQIAGSSSQTMVTPQASTSAAPVRVAPFVLSPPAERKPVTFMGFANRKTYRGLRNYVPAGFESLGHRHRPEVSSKQPGSSVPKHHKKLVVTPGETTAIKTQPDQREKKRRHHTTDSPQYQAGSAWRPLPIPWTFLPSFPPPLNEQERVRRRFTRILQSTQSAASGWGAYVSLVAQPLPDSENKIFFALLHRLARLIARERPTTQTHFMRLLAVLTTLRRAGGTVHIHEWNALTHAAGQGVRGTSVTQYEAALSFFRDMTRGRAPGTTLELGGPSKDPSREEIEGHGSVHGSIEGPDAEPVEPDLYTFTTLIDIAARTGDPDCVRHARGLLESSGTAPNRFTHLALMKYFVATKQPAAVRSTLLRIDQQELELGLDGLNACLVAYSYNERLDVVMMIYRLLRHNMDPEAGEDLDDLERVRRQLYLEEHITVPSNLRPNEVTYTSMVQIMAYHGNLEATLTVFVDMISTLNVEQGAPLAPGDNGELKPTTYQPTLAIFRAIFLGFRRHGLKLPKSGLAPPHLRAANPPGMPGWTLDNLEKIFEAFMGMPPDIQIGPSIFYWVVVAFQKTSPDDVDVVRRAWNRLEGRFKGSWGGPDNRLHQLRASLFPEQHIGRGKSTPPS